MDSAGRMGGSCACVAVLVAAGPGRAQAAPTRNGGSRIVGVPSGRHLDVTGGATTPGTRVQLWNCLGDPQQDQVRVG